MRGKRPEKKSNRKDDLEPGQQSATAQRSRVEINIDVEHSFPKELLSFQKVTTNDTWSLRLK